MSEGWKIWIDTGGTFTDGIAISPAGEYRRVKVLSSGQLRGRLRPQATEGAWLTVQQQWPRAVDIFQGYLLSFPAYPDWGTFTVVKTQLAQSQLQLDRPLPVASDAYVDFTLSAGEEAPVLATRLATDTPLDAPLPLMELRLGFTKGTNALLERKGAAVVLLTTGGLGDLPIIGTQQRPHLFQLAIPPATPLCQTIIEVAERLDANGRLLLPLSKAEIERVVTAVLATGTESVAIAFLHAYRNPIHEQTLAAALRDAGLHYISCASELTPAIKLGPRLQTALVDAYLKPLLDNYLSGIASTLAAGHPASTLRIMTSAGGLTQVSLFQPKDSLLSGPAGGIVGAARIAERLGYPHVLTLDMGGTSTDTARYDARFDYRFITRIDTVELQSPALAIETVAAGGGSICSFDGHRLTVGPASAGAYPGPACYGAGGPLTITDVNLLLGKLDPQAMSIPISQAAAQDALNDLRQHIFRTTHTDYQPEELLLGLEAIANEKMADAIRRISVARGFSPAEYPLLAFGGAGGLHACQIAELLQITTIILPFDAGLLSAYGMGQASVERIAGKQILLPLEEAAPKLPEIIQTLRQHVFQELASEGFSVEEIYLREIRCFLRFQGQDSTLEILLQTVDSLAADFATEYHRLFGYYPANRVLELESIRVLGASRIKTEPRIEAPATTYAPRPTAFNGSGAYPVFFWQELTAGAQIAGPALLLNPTSTAFITPGWLFTLQPDLSAILTREVPSESQAKPENHREAIALELFTNRFSAIAEEMGAQLQRTAFSVNVKERLDFSCALLDAEGYLLVNAPHIPVHLGSLGICARLVAEQITMEPGDVVITNHPKYGGSHLPDVTLLSAVFSAGGERIGYVINRAHHAEIGGKRPGSMPPDATNLAEEGVVILPTYLVRKGVPQWEAIEALFVNAPFPTRAITENLADINAGLASLRSGEHALQQLVQEYGLPMVHFYMARLQEQARQVLQQALNPYRDRRFFATERLDDGHAIRVSIHVTTEGLTVDFTDTDSPHPNNLNANIAIVYSALLYVLRLLCDRELPLNEGLLRDVNLILPESFLHPRFVDDPADCPAVVGGNTEVSQRLVDTLLKAFSLAACSQGTMNNFLFGNDQFGYYETIGGGAGAGPGFPGRSAVHQHMTNTRITDPEELEFRYPVRLHRFAVRKGSGGKGKWPGGDGIIREVAFLQPVSITILSQHRREQPYGMAGGEPGESGRQYLRRTDGEVIPLHGIDSREVNPGDRIIIETPGGGGWGKPDQ